MSDDNDKLVNESNPIDDKIDFVSEKISNIKTRVSNTSIVMSIKKIYKENISEPAWKFIEKDSYEYYNRAYKSQQAQLIRDTIGKCNYDNIITIKSKNKEYTLNSYQRKLLVGSFTILATLNRYNRLKKERFRIRWFIPYYILFSLLFCRENLDPYNIKSI